MICRTSLVESASCAGGARAAAGLIGYVAVFPSLVAYGLWNLGVIRLGAATSGLYINLIPVFTALLAVPLLGETVRWFHLFGMALIFAGIWLATWRAGQAKSRNR